MVTSLTDDVWLVLTNFNGDADLIASIHETNPRPTRFNADYVSQSLYNDTIYIQNEDLLECR